MKWNRFIVKELKTVKNLVLRKGEKLGIEKGELKKAKETAFPLLKWAYLLIRLHKQLKSMLIQFGNGLTGMYR